MKRIREILLTDYIGAITIAFLLTDGVFSLIGGLARVAYTYVHYYRSVLEEARVGVDWETLVSPVVNLVLSVGAAYLLAKWLYPDAQAISAEPPGTEGELQEQP
jgi:hypothetical protein